LKKTWQNGRIGLLVIARQNNPNPARRKPMSVREIEETPELSAIAGAAEYVGIEPERMEAAIKQYKLILADESAQQQDLGNGHRNDIAMLLAKVEPLSENQSDVTTNIFQANIWERQADALLERYVFIPKPNTGRENA
jgi:hypothetical protein